MTRVSWRQELGTKVCQLALKDNRAACYLLTLGLMPGNLKAGSQRLLDMSSGGSPIRATCTGVFRITRFLSKALSTMHVYSKMVQSSIPLQPVTKK